MANKPETKSKKALDAPTVTGFLVDPEKVLIIDDKQHVLYDQRIEKPITEAFVRSIERFGVKQPIKLRKNGNDPTGEPILEVVFGRRRIRAARLANQRRAAKGQEPILVKAFLDRGSDGDMAIEMVIENENRQDDDLVTKAEKAKKLVDLHGSEIAADAFGVEVATMESWLPVLDLADAIKAKIRSGEMAAGAAAELLNLPRNEQEKLVSQLEEAGQKPTATNVARTTNPKRAKLKVARKALLDTCVQWFADEAKLEDLKQAASEYAEAKKAAVRGKGKKKFSGIVIK